jgi:hypothetical protein
VEAQPSEVPSLKTKGEIEYAIRTRLNLLFDRFGHADLGEFTEKYRALLEALTSASQPFLTAETTRYQSLMLYLTLLFVVLHVFALNSFKFADNILPVDQKLRVAFTILICSVLLMFLIKAYVDTQRAKITAQKSDDLRSEVMLLLTIAQLRKRIHSHFCVRIFNAMGSACNALTEELNKLRSDSAPMPFAPPGIVGPELGSLDEVPSLFNEIERLRRFESQLTQELSANDTAFRNSTNGILAESKASDAVAHSTVFSNSPAEQVAEVYARTLQKWRDAFAKLSDATFKANFLKSDDSPLIQRLRKLKRSLETIRKVRRTYWLVDISLPVLLAVTGTVYVWISSPTTKLSPAQSGTTSSIRR